jgi:uncharacterized delta-60 repeat protein
MIRTLLLFTTIFSIQLTAQDFCLYDEQLNVNFGDNSFDKPFDILELEDGKFLILGTSTFISANQLKVSVCRMNADGTLDMSFGNEGRVAQTWGFKSGCNSSALQADGKILIGGYQDPVTDLSIYRPSVGRLNSDGSVDTDFGDDGSVVLDYESGTRGLVAGVREVENGKIQAIAITIQPAGVAIFQLNPDGSYDNSFSGDGYVFLEDSRILWQLDYGKGLFLNDGSFIAVTKMIENGLLKPYLCKFNSDGNLDTNFGLDGIQVVDLSIQGNFAGIHAALDNEENIILATTSADVPKKYQVAKLSSINGSLFDNFGENGIAYSTNTDDFNTIDGITVDQNNNDIYAVGASSNSGWDAAIWKLNSDGVEQSQCQGDAMYIFPFEFADGMQIMKYFSDGHIQFAGTSSITDSSSIHKAQVTNFMIPKFSNVGLNDLNGSDFSIYPNPVQEQLNIKWNNNLKIHSIIIRNSLGQIVDSTDYFESVYNTEKLINGIYLLEIISNEGIVFRKFIKN